MDDNTPRKRPKRSLESRRRRLIEALREVAARLGPDISITRFARETGISSNRVYRLFENWADLRTQAGLPAEVNRTHALARYTRRQLLEWLHEVAAEMGDDITFNEFTRSTGVTSYPVVRLFGSWRELKRAAGLTAERKPGRPLRFTREELLQRLKELVEERGDITRDAFCHELKTSTSTLARVGTWAELRSALRLPPRARTGRPLWQTQLVGDIPPEPAVATGVVVDPPADLTLDDLLRFSKSCELRRSVRVSPHM